MRMTWNKAWWLVVVLVSGCFQGPAEYEVGRLDAGPGTGGGTGGMAGGGGGAVTGGGGGASTGGGGGSQNMDAGLVLADAGLVAQLSPLPEANCGVILPSPCTNDGGCFHLLSSDGGGETFVTFERGAAIPWGQAGGGLVYQTTANSTVWFAAPGRTETALRTTSASNVITFVPNTLAESPTYGFWFIIEDRENGPMTRRLMLSVGGLAAEATNTIDPAPTSNGVAIGTDYLIAQKDGLHSYYPAGGSRIAEITSVTGLEEEILAIASDDHREVFFMQCSTGAAAGKCSLWRHSSPLNATPTTTMLVRELPALGYTTAESASVRVSGDHVYVLGVQYLLRIPRAGGTPELVYRGNAFPQYGGTLKAGSLEAIGGRLYFGSVCHFDFDLPGYGTVELDPSSMTARWLDLDPKWPVVPHITGYEPWESWSGPWASSRGTFVMGF